MGLFSGITKLLGSGRNADPYYTDQARQAAGRIGQNRQGYQGIFDSGKQQYDAANPDYFKALRTTTDRLQEDPYTDSYSTAAIAKARTGADATFDAAKAQNTSSLASRGLTDSSLATGADAAIEAARAASTASAQNDLAMRKIQDRDARDQALIQLLGGARSEGLGLQGGALGAMQGADSGLLGLFTNAGFREQENVDAANNQWMSLLGLLGQGAFKGIGGRGPVGGKN